MTTNTKWTHPVWLDILVVLILCFCGICYANAAGSILGNEKSHPDKIEAPYIINGIYVKDYITLDDGSIKIIEHYTTRTTLGGIWFLDNKQLSYKTIYYTNDTKIEVR